MEYIELAAFVIHACALVKGSHKCRRMLTTLPERVQNLEENFPPLKSIIWPKYALNSSYEEEEDIVTY